MNRMGQLSVEQEFNLRRFSDQVKTLSHAQAQDLLIELSKQMMIKDNLYKQLLQPYLGVGLTPTSISSLGSDSPDS
ncbi:MAG: NblA/ycf18 family protein [Leptolyngbyaceae cyanobacterium MO_188.B28]|nr:NblA/ycf18 family protein [Leptolyngbyaceae cyanobacterium MO_188.B28]